MTRIELDPNLNKAPQVLGTIHLMGVCGTAMGSLAGMLKELGFQVSGSDQNVYPPMSDFLAAQGIPVAPGFSPRNLDFRPDLVIVGNVVTRQNPEVPRLKELGLPYLSLPQALRHFFLKGKKPVVAAGTHGKTTTSSLTAWLLDSVGLDPGFMIGGLVGNYGRNFRLGRGEWFVVEGDEYDTAFFDKVPKFVHYAPFLGILTSVEFDHADIYSDLDAVKDAFRRFVELIPAEGLLLACGDDPLVRELAGRASCRVVFYGRGRDNQWRAEKLRPDGRRVYFRAVSPQGRTHDLFSPLPGEHNVLNTLAAAAALDFIGASPETLTPGLETFQGVRRRQEVRGVVGGVTVIDDFAHHPTAVRKTIAAIQGAYPGSRLAAIFEPRTNTSRRRFFQKEYAESFAGADVVWIKPPSDLSKVPEDERFSCSKLVDDLGGKGYDARLCLEADLLLNDLLRELRPGDVALIMSNGGFDNIHQRLLDGLVAR
ncbi:MAG: UDP-N-acetylmuramate:L-alanyl-gamma-D-glutamyl-meso-diaminopimelate ligase [Pseudomonadota bacterium]